MLNFLYPPIKMVVTDETTREEVLNPVVAFLQLVPFAGPYHMSYHSDFLVFKKHRRFHVALPFLLRTLIENSFAHHVINKKALGCICNLPIGNCFHAPGRNADELPRDHVHPGLPVVAWVYRGITSVANSSMERIACSWLRSPHWNEQTK